MSTFKFDPESRRELTAEFGALTWDCCFEEKNGEAIMSSIIGLPYTDFESLVKFARGFIKEGNGRYHSFHSGLNADIVITAEDTATSSPSSEKLIQISERDNTILGEDAALRNVAGLLECTEDIEQNFPDIERAIKTAPHRLELMDFTDALLSVGKFSLAGQIFDHRLAVDSSDTKALIGDAKITMSLVGQGIWEPNQLSKAEQQLSQVDQANPRYMEAQLSLCNLPRYRDDDAASIARFEKFLTTYPDLHNAHYNLAVTLLPTDPTKALTHFEEGQRLEPNDADYPVGRARALVLLRRLDEASKAVDEARQLAPDHPYITRFDAESEGNP